MTKYILKSDLVAEIKRRIKVSQDYAKCNLTENTRIGNQAQLLELNDILSFLDTLEVKGVDLDKEFDSFLNDIEGMPPMWHSEEQIEWGKDIARHFFELGLKAQKGDKL